MKKNYSIHDLVSIYNWNHSDSETSSKTKALQEYLDLQIINRQVNLINFFYSKHQDDLTNVSFTSLIGAVRKPPVKFISKFSSHILNRVSDWLLTFITKPESSADAVSVYFMTTEDPNYLLFSASTFPSIYHNFVTYELQNAAYKFIMRFLQYHTKSFSSKLVKAFIQANHYFFASLWSIFDEKVNCNDSSSDAFFIFLQSLSIATNAFTSFQHDVLLQFYQKDKHNFAHAIIKGLFVNKYIQFHSDVIPKAHDHPIVKILSFAASNTQSPHFSRIVEALFNAKYRKFVPRHCESTFDNQTLIIFSLYELVILQKIVQNNRETFNYPQNEPESLQIPNEEKPNFESVFININLRPYFGSEAESDIFTFDSAFMFDDLKTSPVQESQSNQAQYDRLQTVARTYSTTELTIFLHPQQLPEARQYIEKIPFNDKQLSEYLTTRFKNSMIDDLKLFDGFISKKSIWSIFNEALNAASNDLNTAISNFTKKLADTHIKEGESLKAKINKSNSHYSTLKKRSTSVNQSKEHLSVAMTMPTPFQDDLFLEQEKKAKKNDPDSHSKQEETNEASSKKSTKTHHKTEKNSTRSHKKHKHRIDHEEEASKKQKQRRRSVELNKTQVNNELKKSLLDLLSNIRNNDTKMWIYLRNLDEYNLTDETVTELSNEYHKHMNGLRLQLIVEKELHKIYKMNFIEKCSRKIDSLLNFKRGTALMHLFQITLDLNDICKYCFDGIPTDAFNKQSSKYLMICLLLTRNDNFYESFLWYQKMCFNYPDFKSLIPQKMQLIVAFYEALFWQFLKDLDGSLFEKTKDCCQYLYK